MGYKGGKIMIDRTHAGWRCSTARFIRTVKGDLPRGTCGTILYETENLGRQLAMVSWGTGITVPMFPDEIEIEAGETHASN